MPLVAPLPTGVLVAGGQDLVASALATVEMLEFGSRSLYVMERD